MVSMAIATPLLTFVDGMILNVVYLPANKNCPDYGDMDCYSVSGNHSYFFCNSTEIVIPASFGGVNCYRWLNRDISTLQILEHIGTCTGLFQAVIWVLSLYLRLTSYSLPACHKTQADCSTTLKSIIVIPLLLLPPIGSFILITYFKSRETAMTGLTMGILSCVASIGVFAMIMMIILRCYVPTYKVTNRIQPASDGTSPNSHEMAFIINRTQY